MHDLNLKSKYIKLSSIKIENELTRYSNLKSISLQLLFALMVSDLTHYSNLK